MVLLQRFNLQGKLSLFNTNLQVVRNPHKNQQLVLQSNTNNIKIVVFIMKIDELHTILIHLSMVNV